MSADFRFKQFTISQQRAPMKVGTDGVLLGAWAHGGERILDVGTGTGLIALMMAQRYENAQVTGIDINSDALLDATENVTNSPFAGRISIIQQSLQDFDGQGFDAVVCNPPFFVRSLQCPDGGRNEARHATSLNISDLTCCSYDLLNDNGTLSVILPYEQENPLIETAMKTGFSVTRIMRVRPTATSAFKRVMIELTKNASTNATEVQEMFIEKSRHIYSDDYYTLTKDFYLDK